MYFVRDFSENCFPLKYWKNKIKEDKLESLVLYKAELDTKSWHFYCTQFGSVGSVGEGCGKECEKYSPRNGKSGRCRFSNNCYLETDKKIVLTNK
jgi:hypothetical protein